MKASGVGGEGLVEPKVPGQPEIGVDDAAAADFEDARARYRHQDRRMGGHDHLRHRALVDAVEEAEQIELP